MNDLQPKEEYVLDSEEIEELLEDLRMLATPRTISEKTTARMILKSWEERLLEEEEDTRSESEKRSDELDFLGCEQYHSDREERD